MMRFIMDLIVRLSVQAIIDINFFIRQSACMEISLCLSLSLCPSVGPIGLCFYLSISLFLSLFIFRMYTRHLLDLRRLKFCSERIHLSSTHSLFPFTLSLHSPSLPISPSLFLPYVPLS